VLLEHGTARAALAGLCTDNQLQPDGYLTLSIQVLVNKSLRKYKEILPALALSFHLFNSHPKPKPH